MPTLSIKYIKYQPCHSMHSQPSTFIYTPFLSSSQMKFSFPKLFFASFQTGIIQHALDCHMETIALHSSNSQMICIQATEPQGKVLPGFLKIRLLKLDFLRYQNVSHRIWKGWISWGHSKSFIQPEGNYLVTKWKILFSWPIWPITSWCIHWTTKEAVKTKTYFHLIWRLPKTFKFEKGKMPII